MDIDRRMVRSDGVEQVQIVIDPKLRVMPALHENLRGRDGSSSLIFSPICSGEDVAVVVPFVRMKAQNLQ